MVINPSAVKIVTALRLVDDEWYASQQGLPPDASALTHFLIEGWRRGNTPNPFFDPSWYRAVNSDVAGSDIDPLTHYLLYGESEGRWPCRLLDPMWYAKAHGVALGSGKVLEHYIVQGSHKGLKPNAVFDVIWYIKNNPDLPNDYRDALIHYLSDGFREYRRVSPDFDALWYRRTYLRNVDEDPVSHYLTKGLQAGNKQRASDVDSSQNEVKKFTAPGPEFEPLDPTIIKTGPTLAKIIAFYLPQFHATAENDIWWGAGFTEWRNVARGQPRFVGHHQPRIPRDLGFYDLTDTDVMRKQIALAKVAGVHGFCFYYYQFGARRLLTKPIENLLSDKTLDIPFCLMWANENWTRRWDGQEAEILLSQDYDDLDEHLVDYLSRAIADARYIRVEGRPLVFVYRPGLVPNMRDRAKLWRRSLKERCGVEPWLLMAQTFEDHDPRPYGLDGAVEFPPHKLSEIAIPINPRLTFLDPAFEGRVFDYVDIVAASLREKEPEFPLIKTVFPSWDSDARHQGRGTSIANSSPAAYQGWLEALIERARRRRFGGEAVVCVNAWNEWAEGAYLEPDVHFGSAYLNATARAVTGRALSSRNQPSVLLVGHDAHEHGAQMTLLNLGRTFARQFGVSVTFLLLEGGALVPRYQEIGRAIISSRQESDLAAVIRELADQGLSLAITNTVVSGCAAPHLKRCGFQVVSLVHEMPRLIREFAVEDSSRAIARHSDVVVFPADLVHDAFVSAIAPMSERAIILPQGRYSDIAEDSSARNAVRAELGLPNDAKIVLGVGFADLRKGVDLFFETARAAASGDPSLMFVWVGRLERSVAVWIFGREDAGDLPVNIRHVDFTTNVACYFQAADVFYLTSREDPFPSTVLEALACGIPVVGFAGRTGAESLIEQFGTVVAAYDTKSALAALEAEIAGDTREKAEARKTEMKDAFRWDDYAFRLLQQLNPAWRRISVVVPNYNYAHYLEERIDSIFRQTVPVFEVIVLDDASTDDSLAVVERVSRDRNRIVRVLPNRANSGSIIGQWTRAAREASGELLWIAEADDSADPTFLEGLATVCGAKTLMAFSDSAQIDEHGKTLADSYHYYLSRFGGAMFDKSGAFDSQAFATRALSVANLILNVSGVLFRREILLKLLDDSFEDLRSFRFAGDWLVYLLMCRGPGEVAFQREALNIHRRHASSATHRTKLEAHVSEVARIHEAFGRLFEATGPLKSSQRAYRKELREQFGLPPLTEADSGQTASALSSA